jgi:hypothetical protein
MTAPLGPWHDGLSSQIRKLISDPPRSSFGQPIPNGASPDRPGGSRGVDAIVLKREIPLFGPAQ